MERLDLFYKAFDEFRSIIKQDNETERLRNLLNSLSGKKYESLTITYSKVTIEEDWINAIERGLVYVEKAIKEDRQFIRNEGEVLPIEKIRRASKSSIQDLAKHSNYITHETNGDYDSEVMPDKLLMIQRESDYAIYENRVVYALLVYLKQFISSRLQIIKDLSNRFEVNAHQDKKVDFGDRKIEYSFKIHEIRLNDPKMIRKNSAKDQIERLDKCMSLVMSFLKTPLMLEVAKKELVTRPITKTNVLRMNINFRESLALFDYISEYSKDGYTVEKIQKSFLPFSQEIANSYSDFVAFLSFLTYMHGNSLEEELKEELKRAKEQEKLLDQEKILAKLRAFEKKGNLDNKTLEEYFELFVEGYKILDKKSSQMEKELLTIKEDHQKELDEQKIKFDNEVLEMRTKFEKDMNQTVDTYESQIKEKDIEYKSRIEDMIENHRLEINNLENRYQNEMSKKESELNAQINAAQKERDDLIQESIEINKKYNTLESQVVAYKILFDKNMNPGNYIEKDDFDRLEILKVSFDEFFKDAWKDAKRHIRRKTVHIDKKKKKAVNKK